MTDRFSFHKNSVADAECPPTDEELKELFDMIEDIELDTMPDEDFLTKHRDLLMSGKMIYIDCGDQISSRFGQYMPEEPANEEENKKIYSE